MRNRLIMLAVLAAAGAAWYLALPPRALVIPDTPGGLSAPVRGAIHVHSDRSDGTGTLDEIAAAAARAGLTFVVLTDHGDATREPPHPEYRSGVLCIEAVEISTENGHVVALGLERSPYPLAGEARDVVEDIARMGGFSIAAHPGSRKPELQWTAWETPVDGLEWINGDSEWRDESARSLARVLFTYPGRKPEVLATMLDRPAPILTRWDALTRERRVVAVAAADAHARLGLRSLGEPYENSGYLPVPSYEQVFRTFSIALPHVALTGNPAEDAAQIIGAIRGGNVYSTIDAVAGPGAMVFTATSGGARALAGDVLPLAGSVTLRVETRAPADARIDLLKDGAPIATRGGALLEHVTSEAGVYRVEVSLPGAPGQPPVPWIVSNPIYVGRQARDASPVDTRPPAREFASRYSNGAATGWTVEMSPASAAALDVAPAVGGTQLSLRYALGGTASESPFVAVAMQAGAALKDYDRLVFTARADRPTRISVQLRVPGGEEGERWHRSVFLDEDAKPITVRFDDLRPRGSTSRARPVLSDVQSVLFVIDSVNSELGRSGRIWIDDVKYAR